MQRVLIYAELDKRGEFSDGTNELFHFISEFSEKLHIDGTVLVVTSELMSSEAVLPDYVSKMVLVQLPKGDSKCFVACSYYVGRFGSEKNIKWTFFPSSSEANQIAGIIGTKENILVVKGITDWEIEEGGSGIIFRKSVLDKNLDYLFPVSPGEKWIGVIRGGIFKDMKSKTRFKCDLQQVEGERGEGEYPIVEVVDPPFDQIDLTESEVVVSGGRGVGTGTHFDLIRKVGRLLGGSYGGTRVAVDRKWIDRDRQIGRTGKVVRPYLYIACGISGSTHHTFGVKDSKYIVAINRDRNAPIFSMSDLKVCGDLETILPLLAERLESLTIAGKRDGGKE